MPDANTAATAILDYEHPRVREAHDAVAAASGSDIDFLRAAHRYIASNIRPVYSLDEHQPVSTTLLLKRGSCSQRMACLEALARAHRIATRIRVLWIGGQFWRPRFRCFYPLLPHRVLLLWPEFQVNSRWIGFEELFAPVDQIAATANKSFTNDAETLFEAVETQAVDFFGKTSTGGCACATDLSSWVVGDESYWATRDEALARFGSLGRSFRGRVFEALFGQRSSTEPSRWR